MKKKLALDPRRLITGTTDQYPICILLTEGKSRTWIRTGINLSKTIWSKVEVGKWLPLDLERIKTTLDKILENWTPPVIVAPAPIEVKLCLVKYMTEKVKDLKDKGRSWTIPEAARSSLYRFTKSLPKKPIKYIPLTSDLITHAFLDRWQIFMAGSPATRAMHLSELRTILNKLMVVPKPFEGYQMPKSIGHKIAFDNEEVTLLWGYHVDQKTRYFLEYWFLLYFFNGLQPIDLFSMKWKYYNKDVITFIRTKTIRTGPALVTIVVPPEAAEIIQRLSSSGGPEDYIFPLFNNPNRQRERMKMFCRSINLYTRKAAAQVGITKYIITKTARHSYATVMLRAGAPLAHISKSLGHKSLQTTQYYLGDLDQSVAREFSTKLLPGLQSPTEVKMVTLNPVEVNSEANFERFHAMSALEAQLPTE